jgi:glycosyltransferase involved in cell wall biosynthesis
MIAPAAIEREECEKQQLQWPGWEPKTSFESLHLVEQIEMQTWANLDRIVAPSQYVASGLVKQGVKAEQIKMVPYPAEFKDFDFIDRSNRLGPVRIGFVGQINLRKNAPVFFEIAKRMAGNGVEFEMVGKNYIAEPIFRE